MVGTWVVTDVEVRGMKPETEQIYVYARNIETGEVVTIEEPVYAPDVFSGELKPLSAFSLSYAFDEVTAQKNLKGLMNDDDFSETKTAAYIDLSWEIAV